MLILHRMEGQSIRLHGFKVGDVVNIVVVKNTKGSVKLGFEAEQHVKIVRDDAINRQVDAGGENDD